MKHLWIKFVIMLAVLVSLATQGHTQQGLTNSFNVSQFAGNSVGAKLTNAQAQCLPSINCILEIDPILSVYAVGTLPTRCSTCVWLDYRTPGSVVISSATSPFVVGNADTPTLQSAITAACAAGGGWVQMPAGTWAAPNLSGLTLCSYLKIVGAARGQADVVTCPTTITTNQTSGNFFGITNMTDIYFADFCLKSLAASAAGDVFNLNYGQRITAERIFVFGNGGFSGGIHLQSSSSSTASTIWNTFRDIHINGIAAGGFGCGLESSDAVSKVINNNIFIQTTCIGGTGGIGLKTTGNNQVVNENFFISGEMQAPGGTAVSIGNNSVRNLNITSSNIEGSTNGIVIGTGVTGSIFATNISANSGTNATDNSAGGFVWLTSPAGITRNFGVSMAGDVRANSLCMGAAGCDPGNFNGASGYAIEASGSVVATVSNTLWSFNRQMQLVSSAFASLGTPANGTTQYCSDCTVANPCAAAGTGAFAKRINGAWVCN